MSDSFTGGSLPFPFSFDLILHVFPMGTSVPTLFWQRTIQEEQGVM